jgi:hypothetical protein
MLDLLLEDVLEDLGRGIGAAPFSTVESAEDEHRSILIEALRSADLLGLDRDEA